MSTTKTKQPKLPLFDGYTVTKTTLKLAGGCDVSLRDDQARRLIDALTLGAQLELVLRARDA